MASKLTDFLMGRKPLKKAAEGQTPTATPPRTSAPSGQVIDIAKMAQEQADRELKGKSKAKVPISPLKQRIAGKSKSK
jgi:hypothetical protein